MRPLSTNGPTSEFVDQRSRTVAFSVSVPWTESGVSHVCRALPAHRSSSTMTPVSAGRGSRQKKRVSFGSCPGQRQLQLTMIKKLRASGRAPEPLGFRGGKGTGGSRRRAGGSLRITLTLRLMLIIDCLSRDLAGSQFGSQFAPVRRRTRRCCRCSTRTQPACQRIVGPI